MKRYLLGRRYKMQKSYALFLIGFISFNAFATPEKKVVHLAAPAVVDGVPVKAGDIEVFIPNGELALGVLSEDHVVQTVPLPAGSELRMLEPHKLDSVLLPDTNVNQILDVPFRGLATLRFRYDKLWNRLEGLVVQSPTKLPEFPTGQINPAILENDVTAKCSQYSGPHSSQRWSCEYAVTLGQVETQNFGTQNVDLPAKSTLHFSKWGMNTLELAQDTTLLGLPVSHSKPIRINRWTQGALSSIVGLTLSQDAEYDGLSLSKTGEVEFFEADANAHSRVSNFTSATVHDLAAAGQTVAIAALSRVHLNRDHSLHYGILAKDQIIQKIRFPGEAIIFFGTNALSPVSSAGLRKGSRVTVDGVTYINDIGEGTLFLDFNDAGKVYRVRKVN